MVTECKLFYDAYRTYFSSLQCFIATLEYLFLLRLMKLVSILILMCYIYALATQDTEFHLFIALGNEMDMASLTFLTL